MELEYRNEFKTRVNKAYEELTRMAETKPFGTYDHRRLTYKAEALKEAAEKVYEVFETTPVDTDEAVAIVAFRKPVEELLAAVRGNLKVYMEHMTPGAANDEIHAATAVLNGYDLAQYYLYTR